MTEAVKTCKRSDCNEPRYGTLAICRIHNNERQRLRYQERVAANPAPPRPKKVWCKDCIDAGDPDPMERLPFSSYCQPHRTARGRAYYQTRRAVLGVKLADMTEAQIREYHRRLDEEAVQYEQELNAGMHRNPPEDVVAADDLSDLNELALIRQRYLAPEQEAQRRLEDFGASLAGQKLAK